MQKNYNYLLEIKFFISALKHSVNNNLMPKVLAILDCRSIKMLNLLDSLFWDYYFNNVYDIYMR
jgi:hypothetical protein